MLTELDRTFQKDLVQAWSLPEKSGLCVMDSTTTDCQQSSGCFLIALKRDILHTSGSGSVSFVFPIIMIVLRHPANILTYVIFSPCFSLLVSSRAITFYTHSLAHTQSLISRQSSYFLPWDANKIQTRNDNGVQSILWTCVYFYMLRLTCLKKFSEVFASSEWVLYLTTSYGVLWASLMQMSCNEWRKSVLLMLL